MSVNSARYTREDPHFVFENTPLGEAFINEHLYLREQGRDLKRAVPAKYIIEDAKTLAIMGI